MVVSRGTVGHCCWRCRVLGGLGFWGAGVCWLVLLCRWPVARRATRPMASSFAGAGPPHFLVGHDYPSRRTLPPGIPRRRRCACDGGTEMQNEWQAMLAPSGRRRCSGWWNWGRPGNDESEEVAACCAARSGATGAGGGGMRWMTSSWRVVGSGTDGEQTVGGEVCRHTHTQSHRKKSQDSATRSVSYSAANRGARS